MCVVIPAAAMGAMAIASTVASVAGSVVSYMGQQATASAQVKAQQEAFENNRKSALASDREQQRQLSLRTIQEQDATSQQNRAGALNVARQAAKTQVSAAESGVSGVSLDNLVADLYRAEDNNRTARLASYDNTVHQLAAQREAGAVNTEGRIRSYNLSPVNTASTAGLILDIAKTGAQGAMTYGYVTGNGKESS